MEYIFTIQGYNEMKEDRLHDSCEIFLIAGNEKQAVLKAKKMVKKKHYRIAKVGESQENNQESLIKELIKAIKTLK